MTEDQNNFRNYFPAMKTEVMAEYSKIVKDEIETAHFEKFLVYNLTAQARTTSLMMMLLYRMLENVPRKSTSTSLGNADLYTIGWLIEMLMSPTFTLDDMIDLSTLRRGVTCWYRLENNGTVLPADNIKLYLLTFRLFEQHFKRRPFYENLVTLFYENVLMVHNLTISIENRILEGTARIPGAYRRLCSYKADFYFKIPMLTAIYLAGYENELQIEKLTGIISDLAVFIQRVNDREDIYGVLLDDGKRYAPVYEDLKLGRLTWFFEEAWLDGNEQQKDIIRKYYGRDDFDSIHKVINVYNELRLLEKSELYDKEVYANLMNQAKNFPCAFTTYIDEVYNLVARNPESLGKFDKKVVLKYLPSELGA